MNELKTKKIDWLRLVSTALLVCAITFAIFYIHSGRVMDMIGQLESEMDGKEPKYPNAVWFLKFISNIAPIFIAVIIVNMMYSTKVQLYVPVYTQLEKLIVFIILTLFIYGGILGYVLYLSRGGSVPDPETGDMIQTLWDKNYIWFFTQSMPLLIVISYHIVRMRSEKKEPEESETSESLENELAAETEETL